MKKSIEWWSMLNQTGKLIVLGLSIVVLVVALYYAWVYHKSDLDFGEVDNVDPEEVQCVIFCDE